MNHTLYLLLVNATVFVVFSVMIAVNALRRAKKAAKDEDILAVVNLLWDALVWVVAMFGTAIFLLWLAHLGHLKI